MHNSTMLILCGTLAIALAVYSLGVIGMVMAQTNNSTGTIIGDITELTNTVTTVAIPAVVSLIIAITGLVAAWSNNKKAKQIHEEAKAGGLIATTYAQKVNDMLHKLQPFINKSYDQLPQGVRDDINSAGFTVREWNAIVKASAIQLNQLRETIPKEAAAVINPNILKLTREQDILDSEPN